MKLRNPFNSNSLYHHSQHFCEVLCLSDGLIPRNFLRNVKQWKALEATDKSDSAGVDFCHLSGNDLLSACKFSMHALDAFCFCPMAKDRVMSVFREIISTISQVQSLNVEIPSLSLGQK